MKIKVSNTQSGCIPAFASRCRGFSAVEVIMTIVLLALGAALAIPSYQEMMERRQVANSAEQLASFINTAQRVAEETNEVVTISYARTGVKDWCIGAVTGEVVCDCTETNSSAEAFCQIAAQPFIVNNDHTGDLDLLHDLLVNSTGRVRVCNGDAADGGPGYETCQTVAAVN